ncbi:MAG TPA: enoyl-CoA hydratase [Pseudomonadales bacterium]|jgi:enoyl-CoA hydratase/carnithine racemase|nr:enoyl-CoA hydratase [Gammaproteobacteria bacterium]MDP6025995.1 enoyl-CoA hydratase [Pseudomonadales bacterium]MDP6316858.1 enoyl-CoA hydratase [Pseudomonadales bacterium]MDP7315967.1 enoyl-CoA hydratase [Pseudomonadales bacterium]HJP50005.1 enoyl-CoA hydratase [Pseudomonadales bacterium]|tara:strand:- start:69 stop:845 length:777 start_codon:yes stop_codon:yes gene_type:complete
MADKLLVEMKDHTAVITINNPAANTWDEDSLTALRETIEKLNQDDECYSLVITGQGEKFFSAGADLNMFADGDKAVARELADRFGEAFEALNNFRGVSVAAINGYAMGGGLECAMACDIRIVEGHAVMALPEATVGLLPCGLGTQHLAWLVGEGWAKRMILCGERINAETAEKIGLVEEVVGKGQSLEKALELAKGVEKQSPTSVSACKRLIMAARSGPLVDAYPIERDAFVDLFDSKDQAEGVNAFLEKRRPEWKNA